VGRSRGATRGAGTQRMANGLKMAGSGRGARGVDALHPSRSPLPLPPSPQGAPRPKAPSPSASRSIATPTPAPAPPVLLLRLLRCSGLQQPQEALESTNTGTVQGLRLFFLHHHSPPHSRQDFVAEAGASRKSVGSWELFFGT
jgi:hypothetical protein